MAIIKCKMCGGDVELAADKTFGTCEYCGSTMTFPKVEDDQRAAAFNRGNHFRRIGEFDKALAVYERIVREDDADAEAHWCCALCRFGIEYVEDPTTFEWLPTCHRASFDSFLEDVDYLAALEHSDGITRRQYQKDAAKIAEVQRGILATSQNADPYDVFICYKESDEHGDRTRDSLLAQDIYYQLTEQGRKVFFARITLEDVAGTQYEPYIFAALNSAKVMIVVGTKPEYLNAVWVKNEWSRFLAMMKKERHKLLLPCYRDMDPYDLPEQLSVLQSYDMGKIGFIQDLTRGIAKVLDAEKKPEPVHQPAVVQQSVNYSALLKRGYMALEDAEWDKADSFFEEVLNQDAECVDAYTGKLLAELHIHKLEELAKSARTFSKNPNYQRALRFASGQQSALLKQYADENKQYLLKQGMQSLQNGRWSNASSAFDEVLRIDQSNAEAYLGKFLAKTKCATMKQAFEQMLEQIECAVTTTSITMQAYEDAKKEWLNRAYEQYVETGILEKMTVDHAFPKTVSVESESSYWEEQAIRADTIVKEYPDLQRAMELADPAMRAEIEAHWEHLKRAVHTKKQQSEAYDADIETRAKEESVKNADRALADAAQRRAKHLEEQYQELCAQQKTYANDYWRLKSLANSFFSMGNYRDCANRANAIHARIKEMDREKAERQKQIQAAASWITAGKCQHCGGNFKGLFEKKCANCGKPKDY